MVTKCNKSPWKLSHIDRKQKSNILETVCSHRLPLYFLQTADKRPRDELRISVASNPRRHHCIYMH
jgi:hypothetical protein